MNYILLMAGPPCPPPSQCWCDTKPPNHPCHGVGVPINSGIGWLIGAAVCLFIWTYKKQWILNKLKLILKLV